MNTTDARTMLRLMAGIPVDNQIAIIEWLQAEPVCTMPESIRRNPEHAAVIAILDGTGLDAWREGDDTFASVLDALRERSIGVCDNCSQTRPLRHHDSSSGETDQCVFGCE